MLPKFESQKPLRLGNHISLIQGTLRGNSKLSIGIDPGVNFGMTIINAEYVQVLYGRLPTSKITGQRGINAYNYIMEQSSLKTIRTVNKDTLHEFKAIVEGAAYNDRHGQVLLEEVRFGFFFALHELGFDVSIVPPASIRKVAFGGGRVTAGEKWPSMNSNAADSIGAALYGLKD